MISLLIFSFSHVLSVIFMLQRSFWLSTTLTLIFLRTTHSYDMLCAIRLISEKSYASSFLLLDRSIQFFTKIVLPTLFSFIFLCFSTFLPLFIYYIISIEGNHDLASYICLFFILNKFRCTFSSLIYEVLE